METLSEYESRQRYAERTKHPCPHCGHMLSRQATGEACPGCLHIRRERVAAMWRTGMPQSQIAGLMGWTVGHVGVEISRMRKAGYDVPRRR